MRHAKFELSIRVTGYQWKWQYQYMNAAEGFLISFDLAEIRIRARCIGIDPKTAPTIS